MWLRDVVRYLVMCSMIEGDLYAVEAYFLMGKGCAEIASELNMTKHSVRSVVAAIRDKCRGRHALAMKIVELFIKTARVVGIPIVLERIKDQDTLFPVYKCRLCNAFVYSTDRKEHLSYRHGDVVDEYTDRVLEAMRLAIRRAPRSP